PSDLTQLNAWGGPKFRAADRTLAPIADKTSAVHITSRGRGERATAQARHSGASMPAATVRASMGAAHMALTPDMFTLAHRLSGSSGNNQACQGVSAIQSTRARRTCGHN